MKGKNGYTKTKPFNLTSVRVKKLLEVPHIFFKCFYAMVCCKDVSISFCIQRYV